MKVTLIKTLFLLFLIGTSTVSIAKGYKYTSQDAKFSITFPVPFQTEEGEDGKVASIMATVDNLTFLVYHTRHTSNFEDPIEAASLSVKAFNNSLGGNLKTSVAWMVKKHQGLKNEIEIEEEKALVEYRVIVIGSVQIQVVAIGTIADWNPKMIKKFFKTFKLLK
jgi:hypothetical protein